VLVVAGDGDGAAPARVGAWLTGRAEEAAVRGPLGALWRLGSADLAVLCGVALGAGEEGLALLCDGAAGTAAAALATAVQPALRPRVRTAGVPGDPVGAALAAHLGLSAVDGAGAIGVLAVLRAACAGSREG
jgi:nicotinate-nucleotide--dimethylbenzimidazole phosphoribosyltransferase